MSARRRRRRRREPARALRCHGALLAARRLAGECARRARLHRRRHDGIGGAGGGSVAAEGAAAISRLSPSNPRARESRVYPPPPTVGERYTSFHFSGSSLFARSSIPRRNGGRTAGCLLPALSTRHFKRGRKDGALPPAKEAESLDKSRSRSIGAAAR